MIDTVTLYNPQKLKVKHQRAKENEIKNTKQTIIKLNEQKHKKVQNAWILTSISSISVRRAIKRTPPTIRMSWWSASCTDRRSTSVSFEITPPMAEALMLNSEKCLAHTHTSSSFTRWFQGAENATPPLGLWYPKYRLDFD